MNRIQNFLHSHLFSYTNKHYVSNISAKAFNYTFQTGSTRIIHPLRNLSDGADRFIITPNLLAITDHGAAGLYNKNNFRSIDEGYAQKLLKILNHFFNNQPQKYLQNPYDLIGSTIRSLKIDGSCTLTTAMLHPKTGEVVFYYIGDTVYGIFKDKQVVMVQGLYESFNQPLRLGIYTEQYGYAERYTYNQIKNDVIAIGSNGLWDNINLDLLHHEIKGQNSFESYGTKNEKQLGQPKSLQKITDKLGRISAYYAKKGNYESPIYNRAKKEGAEYPKEGFLDDITIILAKIQRQIQIA